MPGTGARDLRLASSRPGRVPPWIYSRAPTGDTSDPPTYIYVHTNVDVHPDLPPSPPGTPPRPVPPQIRDRGPRGCRGWMGRVQARMEAEGSNGEGTPDNPHPNREGGLSVPTPSSRRGASRATSESGGGCPGRCTGMPGRSVRVCPEGRWACREKGYGDAGKDVRACPQGPPAPARRPRDRKTNFTPSPREGVRRP